ncbi:ABC transporter ATP-binding protein [Cryobacterium sp. SO1]|uniref:ABC transporter ATP-binding protein n=1 Tax=Cryobacterium sp. SO1 TaxID=1897061 RepID=UPI001023E802|nr:ABC transporter ATP-binding protein [Cryobacterium sp. SO1]RZI37208.1 Spermidine/putrescine import ATP-binding protein PotA [Cryobacterium sp. SO1]
MITLSNIQVRFGDFTALADFSLTVREGEFFTLLGPSGCGKTTALRTLAGLVAPTSGSISIADRDVTRLRSDQRELGMVFQNYALFPSLSVEENIAFGLKARHTPKREVRERVDAIARDVNLSPAQLQKNVSELSGGQQQRVAIARSLVMHPKILLLDEPLSNLDAKLRQQLRVQLKQLQRQFGITTVYVTHDQDEAMTMSDRVAVMNNGRIEQIGTPQEVYARSATEFVCTFIGDANRLTPALTARLAARSAGQLSADAPSYVRTEKVTLLDDSAVATGATAEGFIAERAYQGTSSTYTVDCEADGSLRAIVLEKGDSGHVVGKRVRVEIPTEHVLQYQVTDESAFAGADPQLVSAGSTL